MSSWGAKIPCFRIACTLPAFLSPPDKLGPWASPPLLAKPGMCRPRLSSEGYGPALPAPTSSVTHVSNPAGRLSGVGFPFGDC